MSRRVIVFCRVLLCLFAAHPKQIFSETALAVLPEFTPPSMPVLALSDIYGSTPDSSNIFSRVALRLQVVAELLQNYDCCVLNRAQGFALETEKAVHALGSTNSAPAYAGAVDFAITGNTRFDARRRVEVSLHILDINSPRPGAGTNTVWLSNSEDALPGEIARHIAETTRLSPKKLRNASPLTNYVWAVLPVARLESPDALSKSLSAPDPLSLVAEAALQKQGVSGVVERGRLTSVLQEKKFQFAGGVDGMAARFGTITGADYLLIGMISRVGGDRLRVDMGVVSVRDGMVVAARSASCEKERLNEVVEELSAELVKGGEAASLTVLPANEQQRIMEANFYAEHLENHIWEPTLADQIIKASIISAEFHLLSSGREDLSRVQQGLDEIIRTEDSYVSTGFISPRYEKAARVFLEQAKEARTRINTVSGQRRIIAADTKKNIEPPVTMYSISPERRMVLERMIYERGADYVLNTVLGANQPIIDPPGERGQRLLLYMGQPDLLWVAARAYEVKGLPLKAARIYEGILRKWDGEMTMGYLRSYIPDVAAFRKEIEIRAEELGRHQEEWKTAAEVIPVNPALKIYIQPVGHINEELVALSAQGVEEFFGLSVVILPTVLQEDVPDNPRDSKTGQYGWKAAAKWFLNRGSVPTDALAVFLLSTDAMKDIDEGALGSQDTALRRALATGLFCSSYNRLMNFDWPNKHLHISYGMNYSLLHRGAELSGVKIKPCFIAPCLSSWEGWKLNPSSGICEDCQGVMKNIDFKTGFFGRRVAPLTGTQSPREKR